ncbi:MAG: 2-C-methyl-D-erythritol 2,4-cyclodiphosphate synthase, partial [Rhodocyclaceae bacterium]|nr:2-C-methyl-D-erythritol 2,4-cyclodiphosphate synthase [Rhodocyclaceae bacterium]
MPHRPSFDVTRWCRGCRLITSAACGFRTQPGCSSHSDADAAATPLPTLLGAAGLDDIGRMFPDTDARLRGADSRVLLRDATFGGGARSRQARRQCRCDRRLNRPKIAPRVAALAANVAADLDVDASAVNVKGKTHERLGFEDRARKVSSPR